jgi:hypothetical protein
MDARPGATTGKIVAHVTEMIHPTASADGAVRDEAPSDRVATVDPDARPGRRAVDRLQSIE